MAAAATSARDPEDPVATWTYAELTQRLWEKGIGGVGVAAVAHPAGHGHRLDQVRGWLNRRDDPSFWERVRDVCGLYLNPPERALVLSLDEKTAIQAKERTHPDQAARPGRPRRREFEYIRHGTASLVAALDVHRGCSAKSCATATFASREDPHRQAAGLHRRVRPHGQAVRLDLLRRAAQGGLMGSNHTRVTRARGHSSVL